MFRHTTAVHFLAAGVEVNVIRGWLGNVSPETTNRCAEIAMGVASALPKLRTPMNFTINSDGQRPTTPLIILLVCGLPHRPDPKPDLTM